MTDHVVTGVVQGASTVAITLLALWVASVRPRTPATVAFAFFGLGMGLSLTLANVANLLEVTFRMQAALRLLPTCLWVAGCGALAVTFPRPIRRDERPLLLPALAVVLVGGGLFLAYHLEVQPTSGPIELAFALTDSFALPATFAYALLLALRYPRADGDDARRMIALTSVALLWYVAFVSLGGFNNTGPGSFMYGSGVVRAFGIANLVTIFAIAGAWLWATSRPGSRTAREISWLTLAIALLGLSTYVLDLALGQVGVARFLMVLTLAYAILRHRLLGLDAKVRFALSKSTIAAAFIAVFFLASEAAQQFFGEAFQSAYIGIAAAGALVFAMAPLQRAAERLAERAVPTPAHASAVERAVTASGAPEREAAYREAVRLAMRDRVITREEERHLLRLAHHAGIPPPRALAIHDEVERDAGGRA